MEKKYNSFSKILSSLRLNHYGSYDPAPVENEISALNLTLERGLLT